MYCCNVDLPLVAMKICSYHLRRNNIIQYIKVIHSYFIVILFIYFFSLCSINLKTIFTTAGSFLSKIITFCRWATSYIVHEFVQYVVSQLLFATDKVPHEFHEEGIALSSKSVHF